MVRHGAGGLNLQIRVEMSVGNAVDSVVWCEVGVLVVLSIKYKEQKLYLIYILSGETFIYWQMLFSFCLLLVRWLFHKHLNYWLDRVKSVLNPTVVGSKPNLSWTISMHIEGQEILDQLYNVYKNENRNWGHFEINISRTELLQD